LRAYLLSLGLASAIAACSTCEEDQCSHQEGPQKPQSIEQGILGHAIWQDDLEIDGCQACDYGRTELRIWKTDDLVTDKETAQATVEHNDSFETVDVDGHYEHHLDAGNYFLCSPSFAYRESSCASIVLKPNEIFTLNIGIISVHSIDGYKEDGSRIDRSLLFLILFPEPDPP
jgi:hypothetical protein